MTFFRFFKDLGLLFFYSAFTSMNLWMAEKSLDKDAELFKRSVDRAKIFYEDHKRQSIVMNKYKVWSGH